jgi:hypothetical protein
MTLAFATITGITAALRLTTAFMMFLTATIVILPVMRIAVRVTMTLIRISSGFVTTSIIIAASVEVGVSNVGLRNGIEDAIADSDRGMNLSIWIAGHDT